MDIFTAAYLVNVLLALYGVFGNGADVLVEQSGILIKLGSLFFRQIQ